MICAASRDSAQRGAHGRRRIAISDDPLGAQVDAIVAAAHVMIDIIEALTEDDERGKETAPRCLDVLISIPSG